jgi:predicted ABC-type transport system involved in lysophospholipase L1 biosynthesis ATPase subunit
MPSAEVVLALREVLKDYHGLRPLRVEHLEVRRGESVALLGFDRVAAEVLSSLVIGATLPDAGDVQAFGTLTRSVTDADEWLAAMHQFGILSDRVVLLESFSVEQNLALPFSLEIDQIPSEVRAQVRALADEVGVDANVLATPAGALRPDDVLRVRLAKALALGPRVLLAEHPNAALSAAEVPRFAADLATIAAARDMAMIVMTADATFARAVADRVLTVRPATGQLAQSGGWRDWFRRS